MDLAAYIAIGVQSLALLKILFSIGNKYGIITTKLESIEKQLANCECKECKNFQR